MLLFAQAKVATLQLLAAASSALAASGLAPTRAFLLPSPQVKMATLQLFGSDEQCAAAIAMIEEAIENKEQKQKQRA